MLFLELITLPVVFKSIFKRKKTNENFHKFTVVCQQSNFVLSSPWVYFLSELSRGGNETNLFTS